MEHFIIGPVDRRRSSEEEAEQEEEGEEKKVSKTQRNYVYTYNIYDCVHVNIY